MRRGRGGSGGRIRTYDQAPGSVRRALRAWAPNRSGHRVSHSCRPTGAPVLSSGGRARSTVRGPEPGSCALAPPPKLLRGDRGDTDGAQSAEHRDGGLRPGRRQDQFEERQQLVACRIRSIVTFGAMISARSALPRRGARRRRSLGRGYPPRGIVRRAGADSFVAHAARSGPGTDRLQPARCTGWARRKDES